MELRIQCGGSVDINRQRVGQLDARAYEMLAVLVPWEHGTGWEMGDSITFDLDADDIVMLHNYRYPPRGEPPTCGARYPYENAVAFCARQRVDHVAQGDPKHCNAVGQSQCGDDFLPGSLVWIDPA